LTLIDHAKFLAAAPQRGDAAFVITKLFPLDLTVSVAVPSMPTLEGSKAFYFQSNGAAPRANLEKQPP
jgi:hypothetical protein